MSDRPYVDAPTGVLVAHALHDLTELSRRTAATTSALREVEALIADLVFAARSQVVTAPLDQAIDALVAWVGDHQA